MQQKIDLHAKNKETLSKGVALSQALSEIKMSCIKTITNPDTMFDPKKKESKAAQGENKEVKVAMNSVAWNQCPSFSS